MTNSDDSNYTIAQSEDDERLNTMYKLTDSFGDIYYGETVDELCANYAHSYSRAPESAAGMTVEKCIHLKLNEPAFLAHLSECIAENNAKRAARRMVAWEQEVAKLTDSKEDYSESGFEKRMAELLARKPVPSNTP